MTWSAHELSLVLAAVCLVIELLAPAFLFLAFAIGLLPVALAQYLGGGFVLGRDALIFGVSALLATVLLRRLLSRRNAATQDVNRY